MLESWSLIRARAQPFNHRETVLFDPRNPADRAKCSLHGLLAGAVRWRRIEISSSAQLHGVYAYGMICRSGDRERARRRERMRRTQRWWIEISRDPSFRVYFAVYVPRR